MKYAEVCTLCLRSRPFLWATVLFALALSVDAYIAVRYWTFVGVRMEVVFALPIGLHLPLLWWRLASCIERDRRSAHEYVDNRRRELEESDLISPLMSLADLSF